jgi:photosystem II stability/assembly factor-like uncharacterized protein
MASDRLILGTNKGLLIFEENGSGWRMTCEAHRAIPVSYAMTDPRTDTLWALLDHGHWGTKLQRSRDKGASWEEVPAPKFPEGAERAPGVPATVSYLWYMKPGGNDQPERLYIGTEPGALFQSDDGGDSFHLVESLWNHPSRPDNWFGGGRDLPGICSICIDPRDSNHVFIGVSVGGVFETRDGGQTWEGRNKGLVACYLPNPSAEYGHDPHFMLMSPSNPDILWQQNHCGIFRSADGGQTWKDISKPGTPAYFGFAIAVDAHDADTAWVVPAIDAEYRMAVDRALCVCRTEDGGETWTELRNGLPQTDAYDLVYRHALDISGERLAFASTTGNLYLSNDRGDSWECLYHNLPPVFSVRFDSVS